MGGSYEQFFDMMEDMGFFDHIYEELPADFTAVFEIARVLEDERHPLTEALYPALSMISMEPAKEQKLIAEEELQIFHDEIEEYESDFIKSPQHLPRIYNFQWLLPDEVFYRRLAKKELWVPYARTPKYESVEPDPEGYHPDSRKQNVYILLDTSSSMALHNRTNIAKAAVYHFLKRNMTELGYIKLRTFDTKIGEMHTARDNASFHALIQFIVRHHTLGNGTAMAAAIEQAVTDIRSIPGLSRTEILVITDGACALNEAAMRELLGTDIRIHTVKIGKSQLFVSNSYIRDKLYKEDNAQHRVIERLQNQLDSQRKQYLKTESPAGKQRLALNIRHTEQELNRQVNAMTEEIVVGYGHELERLSEVYVNVMDIDMASIITLTPEAVKEMEALMQKLLAAVEAQASPALMRSIALLSDHVAFLLKNTETGELHGMLGDIQAKLLAAIEGRLNPITDFQDSGIVSRMGHEERADLKFLLAAQGVGGISFLRLLIAQLKRLARKIFRRIR